MKDRIRNILTENYKSPNGSFGEKQNRGDMYLRREDAKRKLKERSRKPKSKSSPDTKKNSKEKDFLSPREEKKLQRKQLSGELRLTPKEAFVSRLIAYLDTDKSKHMIEAMELLEEYPKLKKYVVEMSHRALPKNNFAVYAMRERITEEIGDKGYRTPGNHHNWTLSRARANDIWCDCMDGCLIETKISPSDVIIYVPAFTKIMENVIYEGLVDEPYVNVLRKAKAREEVVLPDNFDNGMIVEVF